MTHHIHLVDDESAITGYLASFLERSDFFITVANNGGEVGLRSRSGQDTVFTFRLPVEAG